METKPHSFWLIGQCFAHTIPGGIALCILVFLTVLPFALPAQLSPSFRQNKERIDSLIYRAEYEAAHQLVRGLYEPINPSTAERFESY